METGAAPEREVAFRGRTVRFDEEGFLLDFESWSEELASYMAGLDGFELMELHFDVLGFVRDYFRKFQTVPMPRMIVKGLNRKYGTEKYNVKYLYEVFPNFRAVCKYAGIRPAGCT
jgi:tRNA 2-thiouridine synthesizing protein E